MISFGFALFQSVILGDKTFDFTHVIVGYVQQPNTTMNIDLQSTYENLSKAILLEFDKAMGFIIRGVKFANFQVLRET